MGLNELDAESATVITDRFCGYFFLDLFIIPVGHNSVMKHSL